MSGRAGRGAQPRVPAGVRQGGQFATLCMDEPDVTLGQPHRVSAPGLIELTPAAQEVVDAITAAGGTAYLVGGSVRDALAGTGSKDVDIEAYGLQPQQLARALRKVGRVDEVGKSFSVLTITCRDERLDVALPRRERRTGPGHRDFEIEVAPLATLTEASARRDFTVNALMYDPRTQEVVDCWGGLQDLRDGVLRHTTAAFAEDPLRVLRGARFAAKLGLRMHPGTVSLSADLADQFHTLSTERVWGEWSAMSATARHPSAWLDVLAQTGWERHFPEVAALHGVEQDPTWHPEGDVHAHARLAADEGARLADEAGLRGTDRSVIVLAAMLHDVGKVTHTQHHEDGRITSHGHDRAGVEPAAAFLRRIGAPRHVVDVVVPLVREHMVSTTVNAPKASTVRKLVRRLQPATIDQWALVSSADQGGRGPASRTANTAAWLEAADRAGTREAPVKPLLTGRHLIDLGLSPGPRFKQILSAALAAQDEGAFDDEDGALRWLNQQEASVRA